MSFTPRARAHGIATSFIAIVFLAGCSDPSGPSPALPGPGVYEPWAWSPTGDEILFASPFTESGERSIKAVNVSSRVVRTIVANAAPGTVIHPDHFMVSADGVSLFFLAGVNPAFGAQTLVGDLYRVRLHMPGTPELLVKGIESDRWSSSVVIAPAGDMVVAYTMPGRVTLIRGSAGERTVLIPATTNLGPPSLMSWSPTGHKLLILTAGRYLLYDADTGGWNSWDALPTGELAGVVHWDGAAPIVYGIRRHTVDDHSDAVAVRYDVARRTELVLGTIHGDLREGPGGYSWSPDFTRVAWSRSYCTRTDTLMGGIVCMSSRYDLHATHLASGVITNVASFASDDWPDVGGATAYSPSGKHIAYLTEPHGLRVLPSP